jgi:Bacterial Ig-like domain (group 3)
MRLNRRPDVATNAGPTAQAARHRGRRVGAGVVRLMSVTAVAATTCALWASAAGAATAAHTAKTASKVSVYIRPKTASTGASVTLSATVASAGTTPTGTVRFSSAGRTLCAAHLSKGSATCGASFAKAGVYRVRGTYSGDATHAASWATARVWISNPPPPPPPGKHATTTAITAPNPIATQASGLPYTIKVTVTSAGGSAPTGTVQVVPTNLTNPGPAYSCSFTLTAAMNGNGSCVVTPPAGAWGFTLFQAKYPGDATHAASQTPVAEEHKLINPDTSTTTVGPATASAGNVTLTATVVPFGGGNLLADYSETQPDVVTFIVTPAGGTSSTVCSAVPLTFSGGANIATCVASLTAGQYVIRAQYSGDEYTYPSQGQQDLTVS